MGLATTGGSTDPAVWGFPVPGRFAGPLRVSCIFADLNGSDGVRRMHAAEALSYRRLGFVR